jgi:subtilisin family serine protease
MWSRPRRLLARALVAAAVALAVPATTVGARATANDPVFAQGLQWGLEKIGAPQAWDAARGDGITIAVVDSGVDLAHEDLASKVVAQTSCFGTGGDAGRCTGTAQDDNGHGTHVAGIAAAATNNERGIAGVAPGANLMPVRVLANECTGQGAERSCTATGTAGDVAAGIRWAVDHGAHVINLSLGGSTLQDALVGCAFCEAIEYAWSRGVIAVIAAGNDQLLPTGFGDEPAVVVTATTRDDGRASYSNASSGILRAARWPVAAPGGEAETDPADCGTNGTPKGILSTYWEHGRQNGYACLAGTSMAAPHVAGALAVLRSQGLTPQAAVDRLVGTTRDLGPAGRDPSFGVGLVDLARATGPGPSTDPGTTVPSEPDATTPTTAAPGSTAAPTTAAPPPPGDASVDTLPSTEQALPFEASAADEDEPAAGVVALAIALLSATAIGTANAGWRELARRG